MFAHLCACVYVLAAFLTCLLVYSDSGDDIELASCPHGQASKDCSMVASCSCELLSEGEQRHPHCYITAKYFQMNLLEYQKMCLGVYRAPERPCPTAAEHYSAPSVRCREPPFTQHPSHMPLERFLQSPEAQGSNSSAGNNTNISFPFSDTQYQSMQKHIKRLQI